jgi:F420-0:gamma-glutamyl ligase
MSSIAADNATAHRVTVWQCIGCGKIEHPQPCIDICQDRKIEFVYANVYDKTVAQAELIRGRAETLEALVRRLAHTTPRDGAWEQSYRAFQSEAIRTLQSLAADAEKRAEE